MTLKKNNTDISNRQAELLQHIQDATKETGVVPSVRELATRMGVSSPATVAHHMDALKEKGYVQAPAGAARSVQVVKEQPVIGTITE